MKYGNIITNEIIDGELPTVLHIDGNAILGVKFDYWKTKGWRKVLLIDSPLVDYAVIRFSPQDIDGENCRLIIAEQKSLADIATEQAEQAIIDKNNRIDNVEITQKQLLEIMIKLHNLKVPAQYKVTIEEAKQLVRNVLN